MRFHFFIKASFIIDTKGWYCATKGNISFSSLLFCFRRAAFLSVIFTAYSKFSFKIVWPVSVHQALLKSEILPPGGSLFVGFSRLLVFQTGALTTGAGMIRGENVYTVRFPFEMSLYVKDSFFLFFPECCPFVYNRF